MDEVPVYSGHPLTQKLFAAAFLSSKGLAASQTLGEIIAECLADITEREKLGSMIAGAKAKYESDDIELDKTPHIVAAEGGNWVQGWLWYEWDELDNDDISVVRKSVILYDKNFLYEMMASPWITTYGYT